MSIRHELIKFFTSTLYQAKDVAALIGQRCHYAMVPKNQENSYPRIYLELTDREWEGYIDGTAPDYKEDHFALEVISNSSTEVSDVVDELWEDVHLHYGQLTSDMSIKGMFLERQSDDYEYKGIGDDIGADVAAFDLRIVYGGST